MTSQWLSLHHCSGETNTGLLVYNLISERVVAKPKQGGSIVSTLAYHAKGGQF